MEKDNRSQNGLLYIMEALDRVQCIVKDLQLAVGEMYENGYKMRIPSSYQNITLGLQPIEISMNSFNQYLLQNSMKADEYNSKSATNIIHFLSDNTQPNWYHIEMKSD